MSKSDESMDDDETKYTNEEEEEEDEEGENIEDDDDDDDDDDEDIDQDNNDYEEKFNLLKNSIEENKYGYQNYVDIIQLTRSNGDLNNLRTYREKMSELFPLTETLWLDWLRDEQKFVESGKDRERVYELFEKAVQDYLSINIWVEYIQFSIGALNEPNGMDKIRSVCERAISVGGYHVKQGYTLWEAYREFENAILGGLQQSLIGATNTKKLEDDINTQTKRIESILKRQLKATLDDMEATLEELKQLDEELVDDECLKDYKAAIERGQKLEPYETALENAKKDDEKLKAYKNYLNYELKSVEEDDKIEPRIQCLFERAITDGSNCLDSALWQLYTNYLNEHIKTDKDRSMLLQVYKRAIRNSPWTGKLWINYALCLEYNESPAADIKKIYNEGMNAGLQTSAEYLELWQTYLDFLRRSLYSNKEKKSVSEDEVQSLRDTFQMAINQLYEFFKHEGDPTFSLEKYWAYVEAKYFKNMEQARKIWNEMIIQRGMGKISTEWIEFYEFERQFGEEKHQRKVLMRGLHEAVDSKEALCNLLMKFEKENGTIESYTMAKLKCDKIYIEISEENQRLIQEEQQQRQNNKKHQPQQQKEQKQQKPPAQQPKKDKKQEQKQDEGNQNKNLKRKKSEEEVPVTQTKTGNNKVDNDGFAVPNLPTSAPAVKKAKSTNEVNQNEQKQTPPAAAPQEFTKKISNNMVFISNLSYDIKQEDVENVFKNHPGFKAVRVVRHWSGKTKGFGYVDFDTQQNALDALKLDRTPINGRPLFVSQCEDKSLKLGSSTSAFKYTTGLEKNKLFVSNLPFDVDKARVESIFGAFGKVKDVRIVTYRSGKSKGIAYVEYEDEATAKKALLQTDNMIVGENEIVVAISNPPKRGQPQNFERTETRTESRGENPIVSSLGSGSVKSSAKIRGKGHMIDFMMPRALATKQIIPIQTKKSESMQIESSKSNTEQAATQMETTTSKQLKNIQLEDKTSESSSATTTTTTTAKTMSNKDFRAFLLKKD